MPSNVPAVGPAVAAAAAAAEAEADYLAPCGEQDTLYADGEVAGASDTRRARRVEKKKQRSVYLGFEDQDNEENML